MSYITREDGERFVIPSYREVLNTQQKNLLKRDILMLSQNYGEYITLQRKGALEYEVAFSPDTGYLLGESIWHYLKRPIEMIYCEAIPNTNEVILVIVKNSSVYLDGSFTIDSIHEELIIFLTQQNNFDIFIYGEVPISQAPQEGKFNFEASSVKSFTVLDKPIFPTLPLFKTYQLQLVDTVLKAKGIGVFPTTKIITGIVLAGIVWMLWSFITTYHSADDAITNTRQNKKEINPYQAYNVTLTAPSPEETIKQFLNKLKILISIPGWSVNKIECNGNTITATAQTMGAKMEGLLSWAKNNNATINIQPNGVFIMMQINPHQRPMPTTIYPLKNVLAQLIDKIASVYPGNNMKISSFQLKGVFTDVAITINFNTISPAILSLISEQFKGLPLVLRAISATVDKGNLSGSINLEALGN
jgi:hypothetical protein